MLPILVGLLLFTIVADARKCEPGTPVEAPDGCNTCFCTENGKIGYCTRKTCKGRVHSLVKRHVPEHEEEQEEEEEQEQDDEEEQDEGEEEHEVGEECEPGTPVRAPDGCNTCICTASGKIGYCTRKVCNSSVHSLVKRHVPEANERECVPGVTFIPDGDCNFCICSEYGQNTYACTRKMCNLVRSVKDEPCKSKKKFKSKDRCNTCKCQSKFAMCTMKNCVK